MLTRVFSAAIQGVDALEVEIEVNTGPGEPKIIVVGLPDTAVKESKDRVTTAIAHSATVIYSADRHLLTLADGWIEAKRFEDESYQMRLIDVDED